MMFIQFAAKKRSTMAFHPLDSAVSFLNNLNSLLRHVSLLLQSPLELSFLFSLSLRTSHSSNLPPSHGEQSIHSFQAETGSFGDEEPGPEETNDCDDSERPERSCCGQTALVCREEHFRNGSRISILVHEMETHYHRRRDGSNAQWIDLAVEKVLNAVPAHSPSKA